MEASKLKARALAQATGREQTKPQRARLRVDRQRMPHSRRFRTPEVASGGSIKRELTLKLQAAIRTGGRDQIEAAQKELIAAMNATDEREILGGGK